MTEPTAPGVLILSPSEGMGGGIETYISGLEGALVPAGVAVRRVNLRTGDGKHGRVQRLKFLWRVVLALVACPAETRILVMHCRFLRPCLFLARMLRREKVYAFFYGADIYGAAPGVRRAVSRSTWLTPVACSQFSADLLRAWGCQPRVVHSAIEPAWMSRLDTARASSSRRDIDVLSVFRLSHWEVKGARELLEAAATLSPRPRVVIAGRGPVPQQVLKLVEDYGATIEVSLPRDELADLYARARVFALATRNSGAAGVEGLGLALVEAQVAGCLVVAPAGGGSGDAFADGETGVRPTDESPTALAACLETLLTAEESGPRRERAARWAEQNFSRERLQTVLVDLLALPTQVEGVNSQSK